MKAVLTLRDRECLLFASSDNSAAVGNAALQRAEHRQRRRTEPLIIEPCKEKWVHRSALHQEKERSGRKRKQGEKVTPSERGF